MIISYSVQGIYFTPCTNMYTVDQKTVYPYIVLLYFFWPSLMVKTTRLRFIFTFFQQNTTFVTRILLAASSYNGYRVSKNIRLTLPRVKM